MDKKGEVVYYKGMEDAKKYNALVAPTPQRKVVNKNTKAMTKKL